MTEKPSVRRFKFPKKERLHKKKIIEDVGGLISEAINDKRAIFLIINQNAAGGLQADIRPALKINKDWRSAIVLNLTEIIKTVK